MQVGLLPWQEGAGQAQLVVMIAASAFAFSGWLSEERQGEHRPVFLPAQLAYTPK